MIPYLISFEPKFLEKKKKKNFIRLKQDMFNWHDEMYMDRNTEYCLEFYPPYSQA